MKWIYIMVLVLSVSCKYKPSEATIETKELKQYYEADTIELSEKDSVLKILVTNSKFVNSKMSAPEYGKVYNIEQFTSIGALIAFGNLSEVNNNQTISVEIDKFPESKDYTYSLKDLKNINQYAKTCIDFSQKLNERNETLLKSYLSDDIIYKGITAEDLFSMLKPLYTAGRIMDTKLVAFKIHDGIAGLYINLYYENNITKTFIFNFRLGDKNEIAGIEPA